jgi:hypothetical protein
MRKIRLNVDELEVHSFAIDSVTEPRGSVRGRQHTDGADPTCYQVCLLVTDEYDTCDQSGPTCGASCDWVCYEGTDVCPSYPRLCD